MQFILSLKQVITIFILMIVGFVCKKADFIHEVTVKDLTNLLLYIVSPCLIINSFLSTSFSEKSFKMFISALIVSGVMFILNIVISNVIFHREHNPQRSAVFKYSTVYSNAGFMGIPLVQVFLGAKGVFFSTPFLVIYNLLMWSHGISLFNGSNHQKLRSQLKSLIFNPNIIAAVVGVVIYLTRISLPNIIHTPITSLAAINTPLSMIVIGSNLSEISLKEVFNNRACWKGTFIRNLLIPVISIGVLKLFALSKTAFLALTIMMSCPVAGVVVLFSILNNYDVKFPTKMLCLSTIVSVITIPLLIWFAQLVI